MTANQLSVGYANPVVDDTARLDSSDYEDLPALPTADCEDFTDGHSSVQHIPYTRLYEPTTGFSDPSNSWLLPGCPLTVTITAAEHRDGHHILNPYLYTIQVEHQQFKWLVRRRHTHFKSLHQALLMYRTSLRIPLPLKTLRDRRKSVSAKNRKPVPRFPRRPEALILSPEALDERK
ncbi:unnamed protein product, partial [Medioppia subpectinata]